MPTIEKKLKYPKRGAIIGFLILFGFSYLGLHTAQNGVNDAKAAAASAKTAATNAKAAAAASASLSIVVNRNQCEAGNDTRRASLQVTEGLSAALDALPVKLHDRFIQAAKLNPPTTPQAKVSQAAGDRFFVQFVQDTKEITDAAVAKLRAETPLVNCKPPVVAPTK